MSKTLFIALLAAVALRSQSVDSSTLAPVELTAGQTLRISVSASPGGPCAAQLGFVDAGGASVGPGSSVSLKAGESAYLDLPSASVALTKSGQRAQIRPRITPVADTVSSACRTSASVRDSAGAGGPHEGIQVHGHWAIDIRDPDGTLAQHREFENAVNPFGQTYLIGLLAGYLVPSDYGIFFQGTGVCVTTVSGTLDQGCAILRSLTSMPGARICQYFVCATGLTSTYYLAYNNPGSTMVLAGSMTAPQAGTINLVQTIAGGCPALDTTVTAVSPAACTATNVAAGGYYIFTGTSITPISIAAGQLIQITVTISFS